MSSDRLHLLEEAVPMVQHFHEHHADIGTWLDEISNEVTSLGSAYDNPEQIKKQQDSLKVRTDKSQDKIVTGAKQGPKAMN